MHIKNHILGLKAANIGVFILLISLFFLGCLLFSDYGMSIDEAAERETGLVNLKYIGSLLSDSIIKKIDPNNEIKNIREYQDRYYGAVLEMPLILMEPVIEKYFSKPTIWKVRHLMTFLYFYIGVLFFYKFISIFFESRSYGIIAVFLIVLTPRFFAESFYNIKDISFFSSYLISIYIFYKYLDKRSTMYILLLGIFSALSSAVRILGCLFVFLPVCVELTEIIQKKESLEKGAYNILLLCCSFFVFLILFYPASWHNPLIFFVELVKYMGNHPWGGSILYMGQIVSGHAIPWHYLPVWITITTPVPILIFFIYGSYKTMQQSIIDIRHKQISNRTYIYLGAFFVIVFPVIVAIASNSTLYNGWRQFYFIYAAMLVIVMAGIQSFYQTFLIGGKTRRIAGRVVLALCVSYALSTAAWMIKNHPFQNVYFNFLAGKTPHALFERDYWGLSLRDGVEYITAHDDRGQIILLYEGFNSLFVQQRTLAMVNEKDARRIIFTDNRAKADYYIDYYFSSPVQYVGPDEIHSVIIDNFKIMSVIKLRN